MKYLLAITALAATPAMASPICAPHATLITLLAQEYGESRQIIALDNSGSVVELFASEGGTWTLTVTAPGGETCFVAAGPNYQHVNEPLPPLGDEG